MYRKVILLRYPKISVVTVVYNNEEFIADAIESVMAQDYPNVEHVIVDGASNDGTVNVIKAYDYAVDIFVSEPDEGLYDAMNKGVKLATGDIVGMLNSDDVFHTTSSLSTIASTFEDRDIDACYGNLRFVKRHDPRSVVRMLKSQPYEDGFFETAKVPPHPTFYVRRELFDRYGYYKTDYKIAGDAEFQYRLMHRYNIMTRYIPETLVDMRVGGVSNNGIKSKIIIGQETKRLITENGGKFNFFKYNLSRAKKLSQFAPFSHLFRH